MVPVLPAGSITGGNTIRLPIVKSWNGKSGEQLNDRRGKGSLNWHISQQESVNC